MRVLLAFPPSPRNHQFTLPLNLMDYTRFLTEVQAYGIVFSWLAYFMNNNNQNAFKIHRWCSIWHNALPFYIPLGVWCADISEALFSILLGIYPEVELLHFLRNPQTAFHSGRTILHFHQQCTRVQISHVLAHTCYFVFTVAIFMMVRSVMFKVLKNQKKWTQKPSSFLHTKLLHSTNNDFKNSSEIVNIYSVLGTVWRCLYALINYSKNPLR